MTSTRRKQDPRAGRVSLVGAGPGDPELLTLKAVRRLAQADVVLHDRLVSAEVLALSAPAARRLEVGKSARGDSCRQGDINALMVLLAKAGNHVVRLKSGDPMVFGRAAEEISACEAADVPCDVVPGITAAVGAAATLKIPLTTRDVAHRVQFATGHGSRGQAPDHDWHALADPHATTVIYMGRLTLDTMSARMIASGADPDLPAAAVFNATRADQIVVAAPLADLPAALARLEDATGPCLLMIGAAVSALSCSREEMARTPATNSGSPLQ